MPELDSQTKPPRQMWRILGIAAGLLGLSVGIVVYCFDAGWLGEPPFATVTGQIHFEGKPLQDGFVMSFPVRGGVSSLSALDSDGRFNLTTNGTPGARIGKHRLVVQAFTKEMPPSPRVPVQFLSADKTPLMIEVTKSQPNHFPFNLDQASNGGAPIGETKPQ